jgi:hypothetical protein
VSIRALLQCQQALPFSGVTMIKKIINLSLLLALAAGCGLALADDKPPVQPQNLEKIEEVPDSGITIAKPDAKKSATEKRVDGKVNEVKVNTGKTSYTVKANPETGNAVPGTAAGDANRAAQFTIFEFGGPKAAKEVDPPPTLPPAPAAESTSASAAKK